MNTRGQMIAGMREKQTGLAKCSLQTTLGKTTYQVWTGSSQTPTGLLGDSLCERGETFLLQKPKVKPPGKQRD